jgi:anthranilate phosphoribosyltransferase
VAMQIPPLVHKINSPADIDPRDVHEGVLGILDLPAGHTRDVMLGSVLTGLLLRGPRIAEVEAAVRAATCLDRGGWEYCRPPAGVRLVGYTGSGKKTFKTFNLSSAAAFVAATGGAHIAKLGSRSASSKTGSRDFIDLVGAGCDAVPHDEMVGIAAECGFGFFSIEHRVPEFDRRYGGRFQAVHALSLAFPALLSPVVCPSYVYGLSHPAVDVSAQLLTRFGLADVTVINSSAGAALHVDELLPGTTVRTSRIRDGIDDSALSRDVCFAATAMPGDVRAIAQRPGPHANVAAAVSVLAGHGSASARNAVALNAALLMVTGQAALTLQAGLDTAQAILRTDAALDTMRRFVRLTGGSPHALEALLPTPQHVAPLLGSRTRRTFHADPR